MVSIARKWCEQWPPALPLAPPPLPCHKCRGEEGESVRLYCDASLPTKTVALLVYPLLCALGEGSCPSFQGKSLRRGGASWESLVWRGKAY